MAGATAVMSSSSGGAGASGTVAAASKLKTVGAAMPRTSRFPRVVANFARLESRLPQSVDYIGEGIEGYSGGNGSRPCGSPASNPGGGDGTAGSQILKVSRPYLIGLLENREIAFRLVGQHRRVRLVDLLAYQRSMTSIADELTAHAQVFGMGN
jgi:hypothetical protein